MRENLVNVLLPMKYLYLMLILTVGWVLYSCSVQDRQYEDLDWSDFEESIVYHGPYKIGEAQWRDTHLDYLTKLASGEQEGFEDLFADTVRVVIFDGQSFTFTPEETVEWMLEWRERWTHVQYEPIAVVPVTNEEGAQTTHTFLKGWHKSAGGQLISQYINQLVNLQDGKISTIRHFYRELDPLEVPEEFENRFDEHGRLVVEYDQPYEIGRLSLIEQSRLMIESFEDRNADGAFEFIRPDHFTVFTSTGRILNGPPGEVLENMFERDELRYPEMKIRPWAVIPIYHPESGAERVLYYSFDSYGRGESRDIDFVLRLIRFEEGLVEEMEVYRYRVR